MHFSYCPICIINLQHICLLNEAAVFLSLPLPFHCFKLHPTLYMKPATALPFVSHFSPLAFPFLIFFPCSVHTRDGINIDSTKQRALCCQVGPCSLCLGWVSVRWSKKTAFRRGLGRQTRAFVLSQGHSASPSYTAQRKGQEAAPEHGAGVFMDFADAGKRESRSRGRPPAEPGAAALSQGGELPAIKPTTGSAQRQPLLAHGCCAPWGCLDTAHLPSSPRLE